MRIFSGGDGSEEGATIEASKTPNRYPLPNSPQIVNFGVGVIEPYSQEGKVLFCEFFFLVKWSPWT